MAELLTSVVLPAIAVGIAYLLIVAAGGWVAYRLFGWEPKGYRDRFRSNNADRLIRTGDALWVDGPLNIVGGTGVYSRLAQSAANDVEFMEWVLTAQRHELERRLAVYSESTVARRRLFTKFFHSSRSRIIEADSQELENQRQLVLAAIDRGLIAASDINARFPELVDVLGVTNSSLSKN